MDRALQQHLEHLARGGAGPQRAAHVRADLDALPHRDAVSDDAEDPRLVVEHAAAVHPAIGEIDPEIGELRIQAVQIGQHVEMMLGTQAQSGADAAPVVGGHHLIASRVVRVVRVPARPFLVL